MPLQVDIKKSLGAFKLNMSFESLDGVTALLGASGCGKSMTLKCIAGIVTPDEGRIILDGVTLFDSFKGISLPPQARNTGYLFQSAALFPNMTAEQNILCGLKHIKDKAYKSHRLKQLAKMFRLDGLETLYPGELSGGQQQRVALARIVASSPDLIMFDEPFSALDSHLKWQLEQELHGVLKALGKKAIYVSHDRSEVYRLCDRVAVVSEGSVDSIGSRDEIFKAPETYSACLLTGCKNISKARPTADGSIYALDWGLKLAAALPVRNAEFVGVRANFISPCDSLSVPNSFEYEVVGETDDLFSFILTIRNKSERESQTIRWEMRREMFRGLKNLPRYLFFPPESVLPLRR